MTATFTTPAPADFGFDATVRSHGWFDLPPFRYDEEKRALDVAVEVTPVKAVALQIDAPRRDSIRVRVVAGTAPRAKLEPLVRSMLQLDVDLEPLHAAIARAPAGLRADRSWVRRLGAGRLLRAPTAFEDAVKVLFTTNCTWGVTRGMTRRLVEALGVGVPDGGRAKDVLRAFPGAARVAAQPEAWFADHVRTGYRARALSELARDVASGALDVEAWRAPGRAVDEVRPEILARRGFGPYSADQILRLAGRYDHPVMDSWMRPEWQRLHPRSKLKERDVLRRYRDAFGPHAGLVLWLDLTRRWHDVSSARPWP